jgi:Cu/Ag efflux pump CusA
LISSTLLTLVVVPAAFGYVEDFRIAMRNWLKRVTGYIE